MKSKLFDFDTARNTFGEKLIEALNSQIILKKVFPLGTVKEMQLEGTGWGDLEVRFRATSGAGVDMREVRVRTRQRQAFFEVRYVQKDTNRFLSRYYAIDEQPLAIDDMVDYLAHGLITEQWTQGAVLYQCWLNNVAHSYEVEVNSYPRIDDIIRGEFRSTDTPVVPPKPPVINYSRIQQGV